MTESRENATGIWKAPQCPFVIEYSPRVLDDIRLAVMDAFFSLPRGGAEIGGVLLGRRGNGRVTITDYAALDCEHAYGPSFTLSPHDEANLRRLLDTVRQGQAGIPVGWYHSHTRSEIFLSDADLEIYKRFFPEPWQVSLVMRPHTFQPIRCGFFFREADGSIQAASTHEEFTLEPLPMRPLPAEGLPLPLDMPNRTAVELDGAGDAITVTATAPEEEPAAAAEPEQPPAAELAPIEPPRFLAQSERHPRPWPWLKGILAIGVGVLIGVIAFQTRQFWWQSVTNLLTPQGSRAASSALIGLSTLDADGQLQIRWDRMSPAVLQARGGRLNVSDSGGSARDLALDPTQLQTGNFTYAREGDSVSVTLTLDEPDGRQPHELSTFLGQTPKASQPVPASGGDAEIRQQRDQLLQENARLREEAAGAGKTLAAQAERNRRLQKQLDDTRAQLQEQIRKRMSNQTVK